MTARRAVVTLTFVLALAAAAPARAQAPIDRFLGRIVGVVRLEGESGQPETSPGLLAVVDVHSGDPLRVDAVRTSVTHLYTVGRLDDVQVEVVEATGGLIDLVFKLVPRHPIDKLEFTGEPGLPAKELGQLVKERYGGRLPVNVPLARIETAVRALLADEGYLKSDVNASTVATHAPDRSTLVIAINAGVRTKIATVAVAGASPLLPADVLKQAGTAEGAPYRVRAIEARLASIRDGLRAQGYYEATVSVRPVVSDDRQSVDLTLTVDAGAKVRLLWDGDARPSGDVEDFVPIRREGSADSDLLDDSDRRIELALKRDGYRNAHAEHRRDVVGGEQRITFTITRGLRFRIESVQTTGNASVPAATLLQLLGLSRDDVFYEGKVDAGDVRIQLEYHRLGFYSFGVTPIYEEVPTAQGSAEGRVVVRLTVVEGPRGTIADVRVNGARQMAEAVVRGKLRSVRGGAYVQALVRVDRDDIDALYRDLGFQASSVTITPSFADEGRSITLVLDISEGPQIMVADITVIGNRSVQGSTIKELIRLREGQPLGETDRYESQRALVNMSTFRSVVITQEPLLPGETRAHVIVSVDEAPATTVGYGGGLEAGRRTRSAVGGGVEDFFELAPRGFFEVGRRNLWGKNRSVNFFSRLSLRPRSAPDDPTRDGRGLSFSEYKAQLTYRSQHAFSSDTDLQIGATTERGVRTNFNFLKNELNADVLRHLSPRVSVTGRYSLDFTRLFDARIPLSEQPLIDRLFPKVRLSILSTGIVSDRRDSSVAATRGVFLTGDGEVALHTIGSEVGYVKAFFQATAFRPVTANRRFVLATRAQLGVAHSFEPTGPDERVASLPASQRFFAGGGTTVRGFQVDRLGTPELINSDGLSNGGNSVVVLNAELRTIVGKLFGRNFGAVGFVDSGNVFPGAGDLSLAQLRTALGFGLRYDSPLGPLRLDFGFKIARRLIGTSRERGWEYHLNLGEAF
jgi:outer membrane protein assembly factor BamA